MTKFYFFSEKYISLSISISISVSLKTLACFLMSLTMRRLSKLSVYREQILWPLGCKMVEYIFWIQRAIPSNVLMLKMNLFLLKLVSTVNYAVWLHFAIVQGNHKYFVIIYIIFNIQNTLKPTFRIASAQLYRLCTIWCGHSHGKLTVFEFKMDTFESRQFNLQHSNSGPEICVSILVSSQNSIYSYPSPGCVLYQWSTLSKKFINQLDCLKLVPCSESLGSISIDKSLSVGRCQVSYLLENKNADSN